MEELAKREKERVELALRELKVKDEEANSVMELINSYKEDADYFFSKKKYLEAFEHAEKEVGAPRLEEGSCEDGEEVRGEDVQEGEGSHHGKHNYAGGEDDFRFFN